MSDTPAYYSPDPRSSDDDHLRILTICQYILAGIIAFFGCIPLIHVTIGIVMLSTARTADLRFVGGMFVGIGSLIIILSWTIALLVFLAARNLSARRRYMFCFVVACIECLNAPLGTVLGVFTIIVLIRPSVKTLFGVR